jgi:hypothetical protein
MANMQDDKDFAGSDRANRQGQQPDRAHDHPRQVPPENPTEGTRDLTNDPDYWDQSQGPNHPLDDQGRKRR